MVAGGAVWAALRRVSDREMPRLAVLSAAFFVLGAVHVRIGPGSVHFLLTGLLAMVLGWRAVLAVGVGVALQAVLLQHGGLTTLGVNVCVLGLPAMLVGAVLPRWVVLGDGKRAGWVGALATLLCSGLSMVLLVSIGWLGDARLSTSLGMLAAAYLPVTILESIATGFAVAYLVRVDGEAWRTCAIGVRS